MCPLTDLSADLPARELARVDIRVRVTREHLGEQVGDRHPCERTPQVRGGKRAFPEDTVERARDEHRRWSGGIQEHHDRPVHAGGGDVDVGLQHVLNVGDLEAEPHGVTVAGEEDRIARGDAGVGRHLLGGAQARGEFELALLPTVAMVLVTVAVVPLVRVGPREEGRPRGARRAGLDNQGVSRPAQPRSRRSVRRAPVVAAGVDGRRDVRRYAKPGLGVPHDVVEADASRLPGVAPRKLPTQIPAGTRLGSSPSRMPARHPGLGCARCGPRTPRS